MACYFDDMVGDVDWAYSEFTGELRAIKEFNAAHADIKIAPVNGLRFWGTHIPQSWHEQIFVAHLFQHPQFGTPIAEMTQLPPRGGVTCCPCERTRADRRADSAWLRTATSRSVGERLLCADPPRDKKKAYRISAMLTAGEIGTSGPCVASMRFKDCVDWVELWFVSGC